MSHRERKLALNFGETPAVRDHHRRLAGDKATIEVIVGSQSAAQTQSIMNSLKKPKLAQIEAEATVDGYSPPNYETASSVPSPAPGPGPAPGQFHKTGAASVSASVATSGVVALAAAVAMLA